MLCKSSCLTFHSFITLKSHSIHHLLEQIPLVLHDHHYGSPPTSLLICIGDFQVISDLLHHIWSHLKHACRCLLAVCLRDMPMLAPLSIHTPWRKLSTSGDRSQWIRVQFPVFQVTVLENIVFISQEVLVEPSPTAYKGTLNKTPLQLLSLFPISSTFTNASWDLLPNHLHQKPCHKFCFL